MNIILWQTFLRGLFSICSSCGEHCPGSITEFYCICCCLWPSKNGDNWESPLESFHRFLWKEFCSTRSDSMQNQSNISKESIQNSDLFFALKVSSLRPAADQRLNALSARVVRFLDKQANSMWNQTYYAMTYRYRIDMIKWCSCNKLLPKLCTSPNSHSTSHWWPWWNPAYLHLFSDVSAKATEHSECE